MQQAYARACKELELELEEIMTAHCIKRWAVIEGSHPINTEDTDFSMLTFMMLHSINLLILYLMHAITKYWS